MAKLIVIEGADRCGKFTQSNLLKESLDKLGVKSTIIEVPIKSAVTYRVIYWMLKNGLAKKLPKVFQLLQFLNRKIFQVFTMPRLEPAYDIIIFDRWSLSTIVYGAAEGVSEAYTKKLAEWLRKPDHTIILHGKPFHHLAEDVYEADSNLQNKVRKLYANWAEEHEDSTLIDSNQDKIAVSEQIKQTLYKVKLLPRL